MCTDLLRAFVAGWKRWRAERRDLKLRPVDVSPMALVERMRESWK